jgi:hypothetical protein
VGGVKTGKIIQEQLDLSLALAFANRWFLENPGLVFSFTDDLDVEVKMPHQIRWAFAGGGCRDNN